MADRMDEIVQKFYEFSDVLQVKGNELVKNPFETEGSAKDLKTETVPDDPQQAEQVRRQRLQQQAGALRLLSIMRSDTGHCCMISDQILRQGDIVEGFRIAAIGSNYVELVYVTGGASGDSASKTDDLKVILKLSE